MERSKAEMKGNGEIQYLCLLLKCQGWVNGFLYFLGLGSYYISLTAIREKRLLCKLAWRITQFIFLLCKPEKMASNQPTSTFSQKIIYHPIS